LLSRTFKVVMLGDSAVGKTSILSRFLRDEFRSEYVPTVEISISEREFAFSKGLFKLSFWDANRDVVAGAFRDYCGNAKALLVVFDVCRPSSLAFAEEQCRKAMETLGYRPAAWLVGNKKDQGGRKVDAAEAEGKAKLLGVNYIETSAKTGENVEELFKAVLRGVVKLRLGEVERALEG